MYTSQGTTSREVQLRFSGLDVLATSVAIVQLDGCVLHANAALEDLLGVSRKTILGSNINGSIIHWKIESVTFFEGDKIALEPIIEFFCLKEVLL